MVKFIRKIFVGDMPAGVKLENAYLKQVYYLKEIWEGKTYGVERLIRLFLCLIQFVYPTLFIRYVFGKRGSLSRRLAVEGYMIFKLIFAFSVLFGKFYHHPLFVILIVYFLTETIAHILSLIFLSDLHGISLSYHRSIILLLIHYFEVVFDFSVLYKVFAALNKPLSEFSALYFSFVANTTLGFGDYYPVNTGGKVLVICQLIIFVMFVVVFINYFSSPVPRTHKRAGGEDYD